MKKLGLIILLLIGFIKAEADCGTLLVSTPVITSVSVDLAGNLVVCWLEVLDASGIDHYEIHWSGPNPANPSQILTEDLGYVIPPTPPFCFPLPTGAPRNLSNIESTAISIAAFDVCGNTHSFGQNVHSTIYLKDTFDVCSSSVLLEWNAYTDFASGPEVLYDIYVQIDGGGYNLFGSTNSLDTIFFFFFSGVQYEFYIDGKEDNGAGPYNSTSNAVLSNTSKALVPPAYNYLASANVLDSTQVSVKFYVDPSVSSDLSSYRVKRSTSLNGGYSTVGSINPGVSLSHLFTDNNNVDANNTSYYYKVFPVDICGVEGDPYNYGRTIVLNAVSNPLDASNTITFSPYEGWGNGVERYELFRAVAGVWESGSIRTFPDFTGITVYEDDITSAFYGDGEFCYKVIAYENIGGHVDPSSGAASSLSNEDCVLHEPVLFIPNAFIPNSDFNPEYKPILTFLEPESYFFQIYNKWGEVIFETKDVNEAWNGTVNNSGADCQQDIYIYLIEFIAANGDEYSKRGKVTLLR